jgi:peptidoglycan/LPS O-acetylase OafA/YrhL
MEGLRGTAVALVFLVHYVALVRPWLAPGAMALPVADALHAIGNAGVDLFFVLSGYLIYGSLITRHQPFLRYMRRRCERLYPAFTTVFALYVLLSFVFPAESKIPADAWQASIYLLQNFLLMPGLFPITPLITVAWSLSYEMFYYLAIPALIYVLSLRRWPSVWRVYLFCAAAAMLAAYCAIYGGHIRLIMFIAGILLYELLTDRLISAPSGSIGFAAFILGLLAMLLPVPGPGGYTLRIGLLFVGCFVLCLNCFSDPRGWLARAFSWTPLRWLGNMSYSYYLLHGLALKAAFLALSAVLPDTTFGSWFFWIMMPLLFCATLPPTAALFLAVERPLSLSPPARNTTLPRTDHPALP